MSTQEQDKFTEYIQADKFMSKITKHLQSQYTVLRHRDVQKRIKLVFSCCPKAVTHGIFNFAMTGSRGADRESDPCHKKRNKPCYSSKGRRLYIKDYYPFPANKTTGTAERMSISTGNTRTESPSSQDNSRMSLVHENTHHGDLKSDITHQLQKRIDEMETMLQHTQEKLHQAETDRNYWVDRMSRVTGEKLTRDNPDVTDLSDPKRPNKLGDEYSELYDNEWTDAMEILTETTEAKDSDRRGIDILLNILQRTHESCITIADNQMKNLQTAVMLETSAEDKSGDSCPLEVQRSLRDAQKQASVHLISTIQENVNQRLESLKEKFGDFPLDKLVPFVYKCTEICWGMVMQSPRMEFLFPTDVHGVKFNKNHFKQFVQSGETLDFVVWPALATHKNGPLLVKGVVQPNAK